MHSRTRLSGITLPGNDDKSLEQTDGFRLLTIAFHSKLIVLEHTPL